MFLTPIDDILGVLEANAVAYRKAQETGKRADIKAWKDAAGVAEVTCVGHMRAALTEIAALRQALDDMTDHYTAMISSGDCGHWDPETDWQVIAARAARSDDA